MTTRQESGSGPARRAALLLRHAHAHWPGYAGEDFDRPLTARGREDARAAARAIRAAGHVPQLVLASPARRTRETAMLLQAELAIPEQAIHYVDALYNAPARVLEEALQAASGPGALVVLVAHNPGISELARRLGGQQAAVALAPADWRLVALSPADRRCAP